MSAHNEKNEYYQRKHSSNEKSQSKENAIQIGEYVLKKDIEVQSNYLPQDVKDNLKNISKIENQLLEKWENPKQSEENFEQEVRNQKNLVNQQDDLEINHLTLHKKIIKKKIEERKEEDIINDIELIQLNNSLINNDLNSEQSQDISIQTTMKTKISKQSIYQEPKPSKKYDILIQMMEESQLCQKQVDLISLQLEKENCEIYQMIGCGGEGLVFSGSWKDNSCAIKLQFTNSEEELAQIRKEFKTINEMENQLNTIKYYRYLEILEETIAILIMEKGKKSLFNEMNERVKNSNLFSESELLKIVLDLFDGLVEMKNYSILHLDIKPENILINSQGNYCFTDFGISQIISTSNNYTQEYIGYTKKYASPEQILSKYNEELLVEIKKNDSNYNDDRLVNVNFLSDTYSLGKVFLTLVEMNKKIKIKYNQKLNEFELILQNFTQEFMTVDDVSKRLDTNLLSIYFIAILLKQKIDINLVDYIYKIKNSKLNQNHLKSAADVQILEDISISFKSDFCNVSFTQEIEDIENKGCLQIECHMSYKSNVVYKKNHQALYPYKMNMVSYNNSYFFINQHFLYQIMQIEFN